MVSIYHKEVNIHLNELTLKGILYIPFKVRGIIIFSHGSGSSRYSKRNQLVADYLHERNFGTLLFDLLTLQEDKDYTNRFNIDLLSERLIEVTKWLKKFPSIEDCRIGYFGTSTGAASALQAAAAMPEIDAVVCRGGRPDLVSEHDLQNLNTPVMLIVGSLDPEVLRLNKKTYDILQCDKKIEIIEGASHLFEENGKLEIVSELAANWFEKYLVEIEV